MKTLLAFMLLSLVSFNSSENSSSLPSVIIQDLNGNEVNTSTFDNDGKPIIVILWSTWNSPGKRQMNTIHEVYEDWQEETGVKIIGISSDDARNRHKVKPYVDGKGWTYDIYIDSKQNFTKAVNATDPPHTLLYNGSGELVWEHKGFLDGDENTILEQLKKIA
jgi:cytochrome c biogenesis protein CcmG/thiol:disulfide interchange protein DsbE